jgi:hypothetical protein
LLKPRTISGVAVAMPRGGKTANGKLKMSPDGRSG